MAKNFADETIRAISDLIKASLAQLKYDKTIVCTVINWDSKTQKYYVTNGQTTMLVGPKESEDKAQYKKDDKVLVLLPEGDISSTNRRITSKVEEEEGSTELFAFIPAAYLGAAAGDVTFYPIDTNLEKGKDITSKISVTDEIKKTWLDTDAEQIDTIAFSFEILTKNFPINYDQTGKEYAIWVELEYDYPDNPDTKEVNESENPNTIKFAIHNTDLLGNPFGHVLPGNKQQILFKAVYGDDENPIELKRIKSYQFKFISKNLADGYSAESELKDSSITVKNCDIVFGYKKDKVASFGTKCLLEYNDSASQANSQLTFDNNEKIWQYNYTLNGKLNNIHLSTQIYYNGATYNEQTVVGNKTLSDYSIHWCAYEESYKKNLGSLDIEASGENWKTLKRFSADKPEAYHFTEASLNLGILNNRFKVVVVDKDKEKIAESEILKFERKNHTSASVKTEEKGLNVNIIEGGSGLFFDYDIITQERSNGTSSKEFTIRASRVDGGDWLKNKPKKVEWYVPKDLTMLEYIYGSEDAQKELKNKWTDGGNGLMKRVFSTPQADYTLTLGRKNKFNSQFINNTIICKAYYDKKVLEGSITVQFGTTNNQGTGWTCNIIMSKPYIALDETEDIEATIEIFDAAGNNYTNNINHNQVSWNWLITATSETSNVKNQNNALFLVTGRDDENKKDCTLGRYVDDDNKGEKIYGKTVKVKANGSFAAAEVEMGNFAVLRVEVVMNGLTLIDYQPLSLANSRKYAGLDGASEIIYSNQQVNPKPAKTTYTLRDNNYQPIKTSMTYHYKGGPEPDDKTFQGLDNEGYNYEFIMYNNLPGQSGSIVVYDKTTNLFLWAQPIYFQTNYYAVKVINSWDGTTKIDEGNGYIAAPILMAGTYDERKFSGLALGLIGGGTNQSNGLFGYSGGTNTFGLQTDGSFYFGPGGLTGGAITYNANSETFGINVNNFKLQAGTLGQANSLYLSNTPKTLENNDNFKDILFSLGNKFYFSSNGTLKAAGFTVTDNVMYFSHTSSITSGIASSVGTYADYPVFWCGFTSELGDKYVYPLGNSEWKSRTNFYVTVDGSMNCNNIEASQIKADSYYAYTSTFDSATAQQILTTHEDTAFYIEIDKKNSIDTISSIRSLSCRTKQNLQLTADNYIQLLTLGEDACITAETADIFIKIHAEDWDLVPSDWKEEDGSLSLYYYILAVVENYI